MKRECRPDGIMNMQHDEINPMEATTIQRLSKSKSVDKVEVKRRSFHTRKVKRFSHYLVLSLPVSQ